MRIIVQTDWDFGIRFDGRVYTNYEFGIDFDCIEDLDRMHLLGPFGTPAKESDNNIEWIMAVERIKAEPTIEFDTTGGNRGVWFIPKTKPSVTFDMTLFDDESVKEKLTVMCPLEAVFDDSRNDVPDAYYDIVDIKPGQTIRITVEVL